MCTKVLDSYKKAAQTVRKSGPTTFAHTIEKCIDIEKQCGGR